MAVGPTQITVKDAGNATRNMQVQSSTADLTGNLSPLQTIVGQDGVTLATSSNAFPTNLAQVGNTSIALGNATSASAIPVAVASDNVVTVAQATAVNLKTAAVGTGSAGSPAGGILTIQGTANMTAAINQPYADISKMLRGNATIANTTAVAVTGMTAQGAAQKIYITSVQAYRTDAGSTLVTLTLNDTNTSGIPLPPNGGSIITYPVPLVLAANTTANVTLSANITSAFIFLQGFFGP